MKASLQTIKGDTSGAGGAHSAHLLKIGKNMIFWRKIVIPQQFSHLPPLGAIF
jgi:hypothetical protein